MSAPSNPRQKQSFCGKEIELLYNVKTLLLQAKRDLNNDITRLAIMNLPILETSQSINEPVQEETSDMQLLAPLDLDS